MKIKEGFLDYNVISVGDTVVPISGNFTYNERQYVGFVRHYMERHLDRETKVLDVSYNDRLQAFQCVCCNGYTWPERVLKKVS